MGTYIPRVMFRNRQVSDSRWYANPLIDSISLQWGRSGVFDQVEPSIAKFRIYSKSRSYVKNLIPKGPIGETVEFHCVKQSGSGGQAYRIFIGRVIDCTINIDMGKGGEPTYILDFTAADMLRELAINQVKTIKTFNPSSSARGVSAAFFDFSKELSRQGLSWANMTFSPEVKQRFDKDQVYLGDVGDSTWKEYLDKIFRIALNQSFYFDPLSRKLTGTSLPILYTKNKSANSKYMNESEINAVTNIISASTTCGDSFAEYSPNRVGTIDTETYSYTWKLEKAGFVVDSNYRQKNLATLTWATRHVGGLDFNDPHLVVNYVKQDALLPRPPRLEFHAQGKNVEDPDYWFMPNDSTYADLRWTEHAKLLKELGFIEQPLAKPIRGEISYSGRRGWKVTQELAWALQNLSVN